MKNHLHNDTKWITILRNPVEQFTSHFYYSRFDKQFQKTLVEISKVSLKVRIILTNGTKLNWYFNFHSFLQTSFKLGIFNRVYQYQGGNTTDTKERVLKKIEELDHLYDYVLIQDYMEESLILMRDLLCWKNEDIMLFTLNKRKTKSYEKHNSLNSSLVQNLKLLQYADVMLYDHFLSKHRKAVIKYGTAKMAIEVAKFKAKKAELLRSCVAEKTDSLDQQKFPSNVYWRRDLNGYIAKNGSSKYCKELTLNYHLMNLQIRKYQTELLKARKKSIPNKIVHS